MYVNVLRLWMEEDHVHMYVSIPVSKPVPYVVHRLKWVSSHDMRKKYEKELRDHYWEKNVLWARWYFVATVWEMTDAIVKKYVEEQWKEDVLWKEIKL